MAQRIPLAGVRVADFTWMGPGPTCTFLLSLLGAEVIRIENPLRPDTGAQRIGWPSRPLSDNIAVHLFSDLHVNKMNIALDLTKPEGVKLAKALVAVSDMVVENFVPGVMERFGLSYQDLRKLKPNIIMISACANGQTGPEAGYRGYAPVFAALGGLSSITGYRDSPPVELRHSMDFLSGVGAAYAALAALLYWQRTGRGQYVDAANREALSCMMGEVILDYTLNGRVQGPQGNEDEAMAPHNVYRCVGEDRWVSIAVGSQDEWEALCHTLEHPEWVHDPRFADPYLRRKNREELDHLITRWTEGRDPYEVTEALQRAGVAAMPSMRNEDLFTDPHLWERKAYEEVVHPVDGPQVMPGAPWKMSLSPTHIRSANPKFGEHNRYVLEELLGVPKGHLERLAQDGVIGVPQEPASQPAVR